MPTALGSLRRLLVASSLAEVSFGRRGFPVTPTGATRRLLAYIGTGFTMAKLLRPLWRKVLTDLTGAPCYPTMSWPAVDGYGFDLAYVHPKRWVDEQRVPKSYPWDGAPDYFQGAVDQGIGRALRFMRGAHAAGLSQGGVFATQARAYAGFVPEHSRMAAAALTDLSVDTAVALVDSGPVRGDGRVPVYESWRSRLREHFLAQHRQAAA